MREGMKNVIKIAKIILLFYLGYHVYLLFNKTSEEIEKEYKDSKLFIFILITAFIACLVDVIRNLF
jgi:hypothetical protein